MLLLLTTTTPKRSGAFLILDGLLDDDDDNNNNVWSIFWFALAPVLFFINTFVFSWRQAFSLRNVKKFHVHLVIFLPKKTRCMGTPFR